MPSSVPVPLTTLLGRERELTETERLLDKTRLLTLTGAGGSGKTRLALELARRAVDRFDEVVWVDLAPIADPELIPEQLLEALGLREVADVRDVDVIIEALKPRHALLVLDNCEHLVDACAALAESILRRCESVSMLATTREALGIPGEQTWLVPPLAEPDAMQLFAERARAVSPSFALTDANTPAVSRDLRSPRRDSAGHRACGGARESAVRRADRGASHRRLPPALHRLAHIAAASHDSRNDRLEFSPALRG